MKTKIAVSLSCCALFLSYYFYLNQQPPQKASRALASVEKGFDLLSAQELKLLTSQEQRDYLSKISQTIVKAGVFKGVFRDRSKSKISSSKFDFSIGVPKAYASYHCPMYGLHPFVRGSESECGMLPKAIKISESSQSLFASDGVETPADRGDNLSVVRCPEGQKMCNPALIGFDFDESGKARLRCLDDATNENCFRGMKTSGSQIQKSLKLLEKANPRYWDEFAKGMEEQCLVGGKFKESDEGCQFARKQINYSTRTYRTRLTKKYRDLAAKLNELSASEASGKKACKQFTQKESEVSIADHKNFNVPGFKIMYKRGQCWRVPTRSVVTRSKNKYRVLLPDGKERPKTDMDKINFDDPNVTNDASVALMQDVGGIDRAEKGDDAGDKAAYAENKIGDVRFYNFQCGPCNNAVNITACVFNMRKSKANRQYAKIAENRVTAIGTDDCRALIGKLETAELPDVVFEKARQQGTLFYQSSSID